MMIEIMGPIYAKLKTTWVDLMVFRSRANMCIGLAWVDPSGANETDLTHRKRKHRFEINYIRYVQQVPIIFKLRVIAALSPAESPHFESIVFVGH